MNNSRCICTVSCTLIGAVLALFGGVLTGALFFFGIITAGTFIIPATLVFGAVAFLGISAIALLEGRGSVGACFCRLRGILYTGAVGTIVSAIAGLLVTLAAGSTLSAIIVGLIAFFFVLLLAGIICLVNCNADCN